MANNFKIDDDLDPAIDLESLAANTMRDRDLQVEVLKLFFGQSGELLESLSKVDNDQSWYQAAHALKGSSRSVGLLPLGHMAEQAETMVGPTNGLKRRAQYHDIVDEVERAREAVRVIFRIDV